MDFDNVLMGLNIIHSNRFNYEKIPTSSTEKFKVFCSHCNDYFETTMGRHLLRGEGCPTCPKNHHINSKRRANLTRIFVTKSRKIHVDNDNNPIYNYSKSWYSNNRTRIIITCPIHGDFKRSFRGHLELKQKCPTCCGSTDKLTTETFIIKAISTHGNKYDYSKVEYEIANKKVCIICPEHGEFWQTPGSHIYGRGCYKCGIDRMSSSHLYDQEYFISKAIIKHDDFYDYSKSKYVKGDEKIIITCPIHGDFEQSPRKHLRGQGCPKCGLGKICGRESMGTGKFIKRAIGIHGNKYDYSKVVYTRSDKKVCIICPEHGEFWQKPANHLMNRECPKCANVNRSINMRLPSSEIIKRSNITHDGYYDYSKMDYKTTYEKVCIICPEHGEFWQTPNNHIKGTKCPSCAISGFDPNKPAIFYYIRIVFNNTKIYKIGITNLTVRQRYLNEGIYRNNDIEFTVIMERYFKDGGDARSYETMLKRMYRSFLYKDASPFKWTGTAELYTKDILNVDYLC